MGRQKAALNPRQTEAHRRLKQLLEHVDLTLFAEKVGVSREHIRLMLSGDTGVGVRVAFAIEDATLGRVPARSWTVPAARAS